MDCANFRGIQVRTCSGRGVMLPAVDSAGERGEKPDKPGWRASGGPRFSRRMTCGSRGLCGRRVLGGGASPGAAAKLLLGMEGIVLGLSGGPSMRCDMDAWLLSLKVREMGCTERLKAEAGSSASCDDAVDRLWTWHHVNVR